MHTLDLTKKLFIDQGTCILYFVLQVYIYIYIFLQIQSNTVHIVSFIARMYTLKSYSKDELEFPLFASTAAWNKTQRT